MENKEAWIRKTLESIDNINRANLSPVFTERLLKAATAQDKIIPMRPLAKWAVAASIILLAGLNVASVIHYKKPAAVHNTNPVYSEYFSFLGNY